MACTQFIVYAICYMAQLPDNIINDEGSILLASYLLEASAK